MSAPDRNSTHGIGIDAPCDGVELSLHAPDENLPWHEHPAAYVCVVLSGGFLESAEGSATERRTGDIIFHPAGERHADRFGPRGACCLNLRLDGVHGPRERRASAAFRAAARSLAAQAALGPDGDRLEAESALAEIIAELSPSPSDKPAAIPRGMGISVNRVAEALDEEPERAWTLAVLAELADRHPTHLARAFRSVSGISIGEYRRRRRLVELSLDLRCTPHPLRDLALAHGYSDQAHMTREFRRFAGCPPGTWRRRFR